MPLIEVKLVEGRIDAETKKKVALDLVDAFVDAVGSPELRDLTFCIVEEVPKGSWAFAGNVY